MRSLTAFALYTLMLALTAQAAIPPRNIPRNPSERWESDGFYEGGRSVRANLEAMRFAEHAGFERWVIDFSNASRRIGKDAPKFQLRYVPKQSLTTSLGETLVAKPAKLVLLFRTIDNNFIDKQQILRWIGKSKRVSDVVLYPPVDSGSTAIEFVLKDDVAFYPHQPLEREGRLVIDLAQAKTASAEK